MTQENQKAPESFLRSKYWKMVFVIVMVVMLFGAPYMVYVLTNILDVSYLISTVLGFAMIVIGLLLLWYLIRNKVIS